MAEKCTRSLPSIRVPESLEIKLLRLASIDERSLSEYIKLLLVRHVDGHAHSMGADGDDCQHSRAPQCAATRGNQ